MQIFIYTKERNEQVRAVWKLKNKYNNSNNEWNKIN